MAMGAQLRAQEVSGEYRLKAAFIVRFAEFVGWPIASLDRPTFDFCVVGPNPFGRALDELVAGERIGGQPMIARVLGPEASLDGCRVLFVPRDLPARGDFLRRIAGRPVLTVSDAADFLDAGGIIQLRVESNKVRFDVNQGAARAAGLRLSSQLLRLAGHVRGGGA